LGGRAIVYPEDTAGSTARAVMDEDGNTYAAHPPKRFQALALDGVAAMCVGQARRAK
jgi:hypothetical protein